MAPQQWPTILVPSSEAWNPNYKPSRGGGRGIANVEQVVQGPSGYVRTSLTIPCHGQARILAARAFLAGLDGRAGTVLVPPVEQGRAPWALDPLTGGQLTPAAVASSLAEDPAYAGNPELSAALRFTLAAPARLNATRLRIARGFGGALMPGLFLGLGGERLHVITALDAPDDGTSATIGVTVRPWLRAAYPAGSPVEFARPACLMRLESDDMTALQYELNTKSMLSLSFVEADTIGA